MLRSLIVACLCAVASFTGPALAETARAEQPAQQKIANQEQVPTAVDEASEAKPAVESGKGLEPAITEAAKAAASAEAKTAEPPAPPAKTLSASIDLAKQKMVVSEHGEVKYSWAISSGTEEFATPRGTFQPQWTSKMWYSRKYDNAPMPSAVFITGGVAIHGTPHVRSLGRPASHGCIRLAPTNAKTFYNLVQKHGLKHTKVAVYGTPKWRSPAIASRGKTNRYAAGQYYSGSSYRSVSAYDPSFTQRTYRKPAAKYFTYPGDYQPRAYRQYGSKRYVYNQRPARRYYYNSYGYGW